MRRIFLIHSAIIAYTLSLESLYPFTSLPAFMSEDIKEILISQAHALTHWLAVYSLVIIRVMVVVYFMICLRSVFVRRKRRLGASSDARSLEEDVESGLGLGQTQDSAELPHEEEDQTINQLKKVKWIISLPIFITLTILVINDAFFNRETSEDTLGRFFDVYSESFIGYIGLVLVYGCIVGVKAVSGRRRRVGGSDLEGSSSASSHGETSMRRVHGSGSGSSDGKRLDDM